MFEHRDEQYLIRAINRNQVNLFLGAGFSALAKNRLEKNLPTGFQFSELLWSFLGYPIPYDPTSSLAELYENLLSSGKGSKEISEFLNNNLLSVDVSREYQEIVNVFWARIYTTNIDNLLEKIYGQVNDPRLEIVSYPNDEIPDRDIMLDKIQAIHLHGRLPCLPNEVTFSISQFARRATPHDHLYEHFVRDYATKTTLFIGTALNEPLLWQYIEIRKARRSGISEERPKSFLIAPSINPAKVDLLKAMNVVPIIGTTSDFLAWLKSNKKHFSDKNDVLRLTIPGIAKLVNSFSENQLMDQRTLKEFARCFHSIPIDVINTRRERSLFLLGASPKWEDLQSQRDAPREISKLIQEAIECSLSTELTKVVIYPLLGSAGSGKSTVIRRIAIQLAQAGHTCYLTNSEELAKFEDISRALSQIGKKVVLFFDNAEIIVASLPRLLEDFITIEYPPICVIACRANDYDRMSPRIPKMVQNKEFYIPNLNRKEIDGIITVLDRENLLGNLKGMTRSQRISEFESKANKQILVAMREATSGHGFDEIIEDEYKTLASMETKILYLCVALATEAGFRLTLQEFVGCSFVSAADTLSYLSHNLRDIVLRTGISDNLLMLRHRRIAEHMVNRAAPREDLREAYHRLLGVISSEIGGKPKRSRTFSLFKKIIHHHTVFKRFGENMNEARQLYDSVLTKFSNNPQFLLQYASLEMEADNLDIAQNYLNQADSLDPRNAYIENAKGQLFLRQALKSSSKASAVELRDKGSSILLKNITDGDLDDAYCYHIFCQLRLYWMRIWCNSIEEKKNELELLRTRINEAFRMYPRDRRILEVKQEIERDYFSIPIID